MKPEVNNIGWQQKLGERYSERHQDRRNENHGGGMQRFSNQSKKCSDLQKVAKNEGGRGQISALEKK